MRPTNTLSSRELGRSASFLSLLSQTITMKTSIALLCLLVVLTQVCGQRKDSVCTKENGFFAHEQYCDYYYECVDGEAFLQACPNGLAFAGRGRGLISHCDYAHRVGCPEENGGRTMGQSPSGSGHCPWQFGLFPHEKSCTRYWHCWNGTGTAQMCPFSLLYNEVEHACDWPDKVPDCQQHPLCKGNTNGVRAIAGSCVRYWHCVGGYPRLERCPAGLAFSEEETRCDWANKVPGCELPPAVNDEVPQVNTRRQIGSRTSKPKDEEEVANSTS